MCVCNKKRVVNIFICTFDNVQSYSIVLIFCVSSKVTKRGLVVARPSNAFRCS